MSDWRLVKRSSVEVWRQWSMVDVPTANVKALYSYSFPKHNEEVLNWLARNVGSKLVPTCPPGNGVWYYTIPTNSEVTTFYFKNPDHALMFKLAWGGNVS